jgi:hypothetical protein
MAQLVCGSSNRGWNPRSKNSTFQEVARSIALRRYQEHSEDLAPQLRSYQVLLPYCPFSTRDGYKCHTTSCNIVTS